MLKYTERYFNSPFVFNIPKLNQFSSKRFLFIPINFYFLLSNLSFHFYTFSESLTQINDARMHFWHRKICLSRLRNMRTVYQGLENIFLSLMTNYIPRAVYHFRRSSQLISVHFFSSGFFPIFINLQSRIIVHNYNKCTIVDNL